MASFNDREKGFEKKFEHDQELQFKAEARRNKLLGLWAADLMGITGDAAAAYAMYVEQADFEEPGPDYVIRKVKADFEAKGVDKSDHQIRRQLDDLMIEAKQQIMTEL